MRPVRRTRSPSRTWFASPITAMPTLSSSRFSTMPETSPGKLDELAGHRVLEAVDARDAVADREHGAGLGDVDLAAVLLDLALQDVGDLAGTEFHGFLSSSAQAVRPSREAGAELRSCVRRLPSKTRSPTCATAPPTSVGSISTSSSTARRRSRRSSARWSRARCASLSGVALRDARLRATRGVIGEAAVLGLDRVEVDQAALVDQEGAGSASAAGSQPSRSATAPSTARRSRHGVQRLEQRRRAARRSRRAARPRRSSLLRAPRRCGCPRARARRAPCA